MSRSSSPGRRRTTVFSGAALALATTTAVVCAPNALAAPAPGPPPPPPPVGAAVPGTPCTALARACVDLATQHAWLIQGGKVIRGPVAVASGGAGKETPLGDTFRVYRKDKDHKSQEYKLPNGQPAPMPFSVFFADGGVAFHSGDPARSSGGCVHLGSADAVAFFNNLQVGDHVQVRAGTSGDDSDPGDSADSGDSDSQDDSDSDDDSGDDDSDSDDDSGDDD